MRCTSNCNAYSRHRSTERNQFFSVTMPNHTTNNTKLEWIGLQSFTSSVIFTWPLDNWLVLLLSHVPTLWSHGLQHTRLPCPSYLLEFTQTHVHWLSDAIQPSHLLSPSSLALNLSQNLFQWVSSSHQVAKALELQLQHQSFQEYLGLISFRMDWFDLLAVQGTLKSLLQHHSWKALILWCSAFFMVQFSHLCMTTARATALTIWSFVGKVISLLLNTLSRFVIAVLPRSKHLFISWLQSPSVAILEPKKENLSFHFSPIYLPWSDGTGCHDFCFLNVEI